MKNVLSLVSAGIIGGLIVLGGLAYMNDEPIRQDREKATPVQISLKESLENRFSNSPTDFVSAAKKAMGAVVHISAVESANTARQRQRNNDPFGFFFGEGMNPYGNQRQGSGSGVILSADGYIVTNNHVIDYADEVQVTTNDNKKYTAQVIGTDPNTDIAVLKIDGSALQTLDYADSDEAQVGEWVLAVGNPFDLNSTVTAGIISAKGRDIDIIRKKNAIEAFIQTDAAVNPGNSGGALVNARGELLGINTAIQTRTGSFVGYSFAIPVNIMKKITEDIIKYGEFRRVTLGVYVQELNHEVSEGLGLKVTEGVVIDDLVESGSAQYAGLLPGDVILKIDGKDIKNFPDLQQKVSASKVGETLSLTILRDNKKKDIPVRLRNSG